MGNLIFFAYQFNLYINVFLIIGVILFLLISLLRVFFYLHQFIYSLQWRHGNAKTGSGCKTENCRRKIKRSPSSKGWRDPQETVSVINLKVIYSYLLLILMCRSINLHVFHSQIVDYLHNRINLKKNTFPNDFILFKKKRNSLFLVHKHQNPLDICVMYKVNDNQFWCE